VPELSGAIARGNINFNVVSCRLTDDARAWGIIVDCVRAAATMRKPARMMGIELKVL
jgi:hypothetical protein